MGEHCVKVLDFSFNRQDASVFQKLKYIEIYKITWQQTIFDAAPPKDKIQ